MILSSIHTWWLVQFHLLPLQQMGAGAENLIQELHWESLNWKSPLVLLLGGCEDFGRGSKRHGVKDNGRHQENVDLWINSHVLTIIEVSSRGPWICTRSFFYIIAVILVLLLVTPKNDSRCFSDSFDCSWDTLVKHDPNYYILSIFLYIVLYVFLHLPPFLPSLLPPSSLMLKLPIYVGDLVFFSFLLRYMYVSFKVHFVVKVLWGCGL